MKKLFLLLLFPISTYAFTGKVQVNKDIEINGLKVLHTVKAGTYSVDVDVKSSKKLKVQIAIPGSGNDVKFELKSPKNYPTNGTFHLVATDIGQNYDVVGEVQTKVLSSGLQYERQSCQTQIRRWHCWIAPDGSKKCGYVIDWVTGWQDVQVRYRDEHQQLDFDLIAAQPSPMSAAYAMFETNRVNRYKDVVYVGPCRF